MGEAAEAKEARKTFIVPTIKSFEHYDFARAKISCSLTWLVAKAFGSGRGRLFTLSETLTVKNRLKETCGINMLFVLAMFKE